MMYYGHGGYGFDPFFGVFHFFGGLILLLIIIFVIFALFRRGGRGHRWTMWHAHDALAILNERFAKGEIDKAEYEERRKALLGEK